MENVLSIDKLSKNFGSFQAVKQLELQIPKGSIYGILGPNGSGKTTTLAMLLDVLGPSSGTFRWFGKPSSPETRKRIGAILEAPLFYPYLSGYDNLRIVAEIRGVQLESIDDRLKLVGLEERKDSPFKTYSLGMKQRLAIAAALLGDPEVLILDEPTNGLDPQGIADIRALVKVIAEQGVTILLASHLLDEVEKVCDHVAVLRRGELLFAGRVEELSSSGPKVTVASHDMPQLRKALEALPAISSITENEEGFLCSVEGEVDPAELNRHLFDEGIVLSRLVLRKSRLEEQFLELTRENS